MQGQARQGIPPVRLPWAISETRRRKTVPARRVWTVAAWEGSVTKKEINPERKERSGGRNTSRTMSTPCTQILVSTYHSPSKEERNGWCQGWGRGSTTPAWNILLCQTARRCSENYSDRSQLASWTKSGKTWASGSIMWKEENNIHNFAAKTT